MRRLSLILVTAALVASPASAVAAQPTIEDILDRSDVLVFEDFYLCPGFSVTGTFYAERTDKIFYDAAGNATRLLIRVNYKGFLTNASNGVSLPDNGSYHSDIDLVTGKMTFTGGVRVVTAPGAGNLLQDTGRQIYDSAFNLLFAAGPHEDTLFGTPELCAALSGE